MWRPWLKFLKSMLWPRLCRCHSAHAVADFPRAWEIDAAFELRKANESESDKEDDDSGAEEEPIILPASIPSSNGKRSPGFADFLQFLELGCGGSPLGGYPTVIVVLSSIPPSVCNHSIILFAIL
jgi:hypothetical protein